MEEFVQDVGDQMPNKASLEWVISQANDLIERYAALRRDQKKLDEVVRLKRSLPPGMPDWARAFKTTVPYDGIKAGVRVFFGLGEQGSFFFFFFFVKKISGFG